MGASHSGATFGPVPEPSDRPHALLVGSAGGHLAQLVRLEPWWKKCDRTWVTFEKPDATSLLADEEVIWAYHPTTRNVVNLMRNFGLAVRELRRVRPDIIVSTGAAVAVPFFVLGRLMGIPTVYVEVFDRIDSPTLTGRICRPIASRFCVQWPEQSRHYPGSVVIGPLL